MVSWKERPVAQVMADESGRPVTPLQLANRLLRQRDWDSAMRTYLDIWQQTPALRAVVQMNIAFIHRHAADGDISRDVLERSARLMGTTGRGAEAIRPCKHSAAVETRVPDPHLFADEQRALMPGESPLHRALVQALGIEQIYVVNLSRRPDRYVRVLREMRRHGLAVRRIDAVDAKDSAAARAAHTAFRARGLDDRRPSSRHISDGVMAQYKTRLSIGVFAYALSQAEVLRDALRGRYRRILVLDDDVFFRSDAAERLMALGPRLPESLKVLLLGASEYADRSSKDFWQAKLAEHEDLYTPLPGLTCGSFAMVYDQSCYEELLEAVTEADGTFDNVALGAIYMRHPGECLVVDPAICIPDVGDSDIRPNARVQAKHSERMRWEYTRYPEYTAPFHVTVLVNSFDSLRHIESLRQEMPSKIFLAIYYLSDDGLRPVIPGHWFVPIDREALPIGVADGTELRTVAHSMRVPRSDIVMAWPDHRGVTGEAILSTFALALEAANRSGHLDGVVAGVPYCIDVDTPVRPHMHSIVIPCYRDVQHVWHSIRSALSQDAEDFEVIVVNDNPSHEKFESELVSRVKAWAVESGRNDVDTRLTVIAHTINRNAAAARNTGLLVARGSFISFLDDDDCFESNRLSAVEMTLVQASGDVGACYCGYSGAWHGKRDVDRFPQGDLSDHVLTLRYGAHYMCTNTITYLRESLQRLGGFNESYRRHQDLELMVRFFEQFRITAVPEFLVQNRPRPVPETFVADISDLCKLKLQFLADMRVEVVRRGAAFVDQVLDAHTRDIVKRDKSMSPATAATIRTFLASALRLQ